MPARLLERLRASAPWRRRHHPTDPGELLLTRRRVYILPTKAGVGYGILLVVLLIGSINYNLGLGHALTFLLGACAVVDLYFTYRNLVRLRLKPARVQPVFAGEDAQFELHLVNRTADDRYAIRIDFVHAGLGRHVADVMAGSDASVLLSAATVERGWMAAPRVRLHTRFPLGLFRAWSYWQPDLAVLVYPFPEPVAPPLPTSGAPTDDGHGQAGNEDFAGIRSYQPGDALRHLAWRQIARLDPSLGGQLVTKQFEGGALDELVLDFDALPGFMSLELRLSRMTRWVLDAEQRALPYGFRMGGHDFAPAVGAAHQAACLRLLALHGLQREAS
jgi:uncharacterized protein (DUF58 family)